ncbi:MAG TPA: tetratricopeptide repeat protein [candidate division Zixibacteria bacterium]|nr:tetratricopeptide repeat protein [candidate division Zixibacteria bacterium]
MAKHDMKEDRFVTSMARGASYAKENIQSVVVVVILALVFIAGIVLLGYHMSSKKTNAQRILGVAQVAYKVGDYLEARDSLLVLHEKYPKSEPAKVGNFLLGHIYYATGMPDSAEVFWKKFLDRDPKDKDMIVGAMAGLAGVMADRGEYRNAAVELERIYNDYPDFFDRANLLYKSAMNYRAAGEKAKTTELLAKFIEEYPDDPMTVKAKFFLAAEEAA